MFKRNLIVALACGGALLGTPAFAQDSDEPFSGFYVGGQVGYDLQTNDIGSIIEYDRDNNGDFDEPVLTATGANAFSPGNCNGKARTTQNAGCENDRSRVSYYGRVGFDKQAGNIVFGGFASFGRAGVTDYVSSFSTTPANYVFARKIEWEASAQARVGYAANTTLFYGTGGVGYANIDHFFFTSNTANAFSDTGNEKELGFIAGGGIEQKIGQNLSIGLEYSYHDYKDDEYFVRASRGTAALTNPFILPPDTTGTTFRRSDNNFRWHSLRASATFRF